jgi:hypothetical protein
MPNCEDNEEKKSGCTHKVNKTQKSHSPKLRKLKILKLSYSFG